MSYLNGASDFTVVARVMLAADASDNDNRYILTSRDTGYFVPKGFAVGFFNNGGAYIEVNISDFTSRAHSTPKETYGTWHTYFWRWKNNEVGIKIDSNPMTTSFSPDGTPMVNDLDGYNAFRDAKGSATAPFDRGFEGSIQWIDVYPTALDEAAMNTLVDQPNDGTQHGISDGWNFEADSVADPIVFSNKVSGRPDLTVNGVTAVGVEA